MARQNTVLSRSDVFLRKFTELIGVSAGKTQQYGTDQSGHESGLSQREDTRWRTDHHETRRMPSKFRIRWVFGLL